MTQKTLIIITTLTLVTLFVLTDRSFSFLNNGFLSKYETYLEPLFLLTIGSLASTLIILFRKEIFKKWFQKFFIWYFPLSFLLTFTFPTSSYTMPHRFDVSVLFGVVMVLVTLGMVGYAHYRKK